MHESSAIKTREISHLAMYIAMTGAMLGGRKNAQYDMQQMIKGMQRYQASPYQARKCTYEVIWQISGTGLRQIGKNRPSAEHSVLLVPSLVNKSDIFDLCEERSMAGWFYDQGYNVCILDWGDFSGEKDIDLSDIIHHRLCSALDYLKSNTNGNIHCLGYCMGGNLCLGAAFLKPDTLKSLTVLASPWDFNQGQKTLLSRIQFWAPAALMQAEKKHVLSANSLQMLFASVDPLLAQKKFSKFSEMKEGCEDSNIFIAVEDWLNDGVDIPKKIAFEAINDWYLKNVLAKSEWYVHGTKIDISELNIPVCVVASKKDKLVDYESSIQIQKYIKHAKLLQPDCGHIGMIAGSKSIEEVWRPVSEWMKSV